MKLHSVFFSVVIPLYNKEESIISTLDSVLRQSFQDFEIIIVNDGSTDNSLQVVEHYIETHPIKQDIRLVNKQNGGVSSARNLGIKESQGRYIALLDADDLWLDHYLKTQAELIRDFPNKSLYYTSYSAIGANGIVEERTGDYVPSFRGELSNPWAFPMKPWTTTTVFTKADVLAVGLFDEQLSIGEDLDLWYRLILLRGAAADSTDCAIYRLSAENRISHLCVPLSQCILSKIPYYRVYRERDPEFRLYFDNVMADRLGYYLRRPQYHFEAKKLVKQLDMSILPRNKRLRLCFPIFSYFSDKIRHMLNSKA